MEETGASQSQLSESNNVLDLSWTYDISANLEPAAGMHTDDVSLIPTPVPSVPLNEDTGSQVNVCEEGDKLTKCRKKLLNSTLPHIKDGFSHTDPSNTRESSAKSENKQSVPDDTHIRNTLDAFYELSFQKECNKGDNLCNKISHQLSKQISELQANKQMYALRSFQLARVILHRDGIKVLQDNSKDCLFSSPTYTDSALHTKCVPGFSEDVRSFIMKCNKK